MLAISVNLLAVEAPAPPPPLAEFLPDHPWLDDHGVKIRATGGGVLFHQGTYYWYGEGGSGTVHCYTSIDLYHWKDAGLVFQPSEDPQSQMARGYVLERPKVIYNQKTNKFVLWFHHELKGSNYGSARTAVAVADRPTGPFTFVQSFRPNANVWPEKVTEELKNPKPETPKLEKALSRDFATGQMSRDMTVFVDDDGSAYHITTSEDNRTLHLSKLSDDYLSFSGHYVRVLPFKMNEAPAICKHAGRYWLLTSGVSGWDPNAARSAVADSIWGPWTELGNPVYGVNPLNGLDPRATFGGQSTFILPVNGKPGAFIALFDNWASRNYIWLPIQFTKDRFVIIWRDSWSLADFEREYPPLEPTISPAEEIVQGKIATFTLSSEEPGVAIRYTTDGSLPNIKSPIYQSPVTLTQSCRVRAIAVKNGTLSTFLNQDYIFTKPPPPLPQIPIEMVAASVHDPLTGKIMKTDTAVVATVTPEQPLLLHRTSYYAGLLLRTPSSLTYSLKPEWRRFVAIVGIKDGKGCRHGGGVKFVVSIDGDVVEMSPMYKAPGETGFLDVAIPSGAQELRLDVEHGGDGIPQDNAALINAGFVTESYLKNDVVNPI